jgi:hypothetical protein
VLKKQVNKYIKRKKEKEKKKKVLIGKALYRENPEKKRAFVFTTLWFSCRSGKSWLDNQKDPGKTRLVEEMQQCGA